MLRDPVADEALIAELQPGERLLWSGRPDTTRWFVPDAHPRQQLTVATGAFGVFISALIVTTSLRGGVSVIGLLALLWAAVLGAYALYLLVGRVLARRYFGRRTFYGLTDLRALVIHPTVMGGRQMASVWLATAPAVTQRIRRDGHGTVMIGATLYQQVAWFAGDPGWFLAKPYERPLVAFWNIPDAADVSRLAARLITEAETV